MYNPAALKTCFYLCTCLEFHSCYVEGERNGPLKFQPYKRLVYVQTFKVAYYTDVCTNILPQKKIFSNVCTYVDND